MFDTSEKTPQITGVCVQEVLKAQEVLKNQESLKGNFCNYICEKSKIRETV